MSDVCCFSWASTVFFFKIAVFDTNGPKTHQTISRHIRRSNHSDLSHSYFSYPNNPNRFFIPFDDSSSLSSDSPLISFTIWSLTNQYILHFVLSLLSLMDSFCFSPSDFLYKTLSLHFLLQILFTQLLIRVLFRLSFAAMNSNGKSTSEKPKAVDTDSSPGPIKLIGTPYVSLDHSISEPHSKQAKGEASVTSGLTKLSGKTSVSSGILIGVPKSRNPNGENPYHFLLKL